MIAKNIEEISLSYQMHVDSVHATIENKLRRKIIWAPSEWPTVIRNAKNNVLYHVTKMTFDKFKNFKALQYCIIPDSIKKQTLVNHCNS